MCELLQVGWEHEQFSRQRITAITLSQLEEAPELFQHTGGIADTRYAFLYFTAIDCSFICVDKVPVVG